MSEKAQQKLLADRAGKLDQIVAAGINPYPSSAKRSHTALQFQQDFKMLLAKKKPLYVVGRIKAMRRLGQITFIRLEDGTGSLQIIFKKETLKKDYQLLKLFEVGDFLQVSGRAVLSKTKEPSVEGQRFSILTKALRPLPDKFHGLKDTETKLRNQELDLIMNATSRDIFRKRALLVRYLRDFLDSRNFLEVETPILQPLPGGAEATPFITHHEALDVDLYLRIASELYLKRLIVAGFERVYEIGKDFRNEGISPQHLQEFTMLEYYLAYADYKTLIKLTESMLSEVLKKTFGTLQFDYADKKLNFATPWSQIDFYEQIKKETGIDLEQLKSKDDIIKAIKQKKLKVHLEKGAGIGRVIDNLYKATVRPKLIQPTIVTGHPVSLSPLAKADPGRAGHVERFQIVVAGFEIANAYSELNDPRDQKQRFEKASKLRDQGDREAHVMDQDFVKALEYGMPPTAGFGLGIDRLMAIATNSQNIRQVVFFPPMRPKKN